MTTLYEFDERTFKIKETLKSWTITYVHDLDERIVIKLVASKKDCPTLDDAKAMIQEVFKEVNF